MSALRRLFPPQFDNRYEGQRLALWLLGLLIGLKLVMSVNSILNPEGVATGADGFQLARYGAEGARAVMLLFALGALGQLALFLVGIAALVRYRSMVPFAFLLSLLDFAGRRALAQAYSLARAESAWAASIINGVVLALLLAGLALSLWPRRWRET